MNNNLIRVTSQSIEIALRDEAMAIKEAALEKAALIGKVENKDQQDRAVQAQYALKEVDSSIEKARKAAVQPFLDAQRKVNTMAKEFCHETGMELMRLSKLIGNYQALELKRIRAEENARREALLEAERKREAEIAAAKTHEQVEAVQAKFEKAQQAIAPPPEPTRTEGQIVREEIVIDEIDVWKLAKNRPDLVDITPRKRELKEQLGLGITVPGVKWHKEVRASVRLAPAKNGKIIEV